MQPHSTRTAGASPRKKKLAPAPAAPQDSTEFCKKHPHYKRILDEPQLRSITPEQYVKILQSHPKSDEDRAVSKAIDSATLMTNVEQPALFLRAQFSKLEVSDAGGDTRTSSLKKGAETKPKKGKGAPFL